MFCGALSVLSGTPQVALRFHVKFIVICLPKDDLSLSSCLGQLLGDEIGKGAYGRVYKGLDLENGDFVAIKQVSLENIPPEDLASIMVCDRNLR